MAAAVDDTAHRVTTWEVDPDGVALLTLDRPDRLNAWTGRMEYEYRAAMAAAETDPAVRVVVVTGAGRGFCAGADVKALDLTRETGRHSTGLSEPMPPVPGPASGPAGGARPGAVPPRPDFEHALMHEAFGSPDFAEGSAALSEKRLPRFGSLGPLGARP